MTTTWTEAHELARTRAHAKALEPVQEAPVAEVTAIRAVPPPKPKPKPRRKFERHYDGRIERIADVVASVVGIPKADILGDRKLRSIATARQIVCYLARHYTCPQASYPEIGRAIGRDHTSAVHGAALITRAVAEKGDLARLLSECVARLEGSGNG